MRTNKNTIIQKTGKSIQIFNTDKSILYTLNESASFIFGELQKNRKKEEIIGNLVKKYDISKKLAQEDFDDFVNLIKRKKI